jgi:bifunctional UDP-N-acetylglucosamine pyrophosphorylase/glucosamine-1-phosphate N-acetyltransferase
MSRERVSLVLAAGASTRMKSKKSKLLHNVLGRPAIYWALDQARWFSDRIVVVVGHQRDELMKVVADYHLDVDIKFATQTEQKGTAHAVQSAFHEIEKWKLEEADIFIMGGDAFLLQRETLEEFSKVHQSTGSVLSLMTAVLDDAGAYGRIIRNERGQIERIVEAKEASRPELAVREMNAGFYCADWNFLRETLQSVSNSNRSKEFYLTDLVSLARNQNRLVQTLTIPYQESLGINTQEDLALVASIFQKRVNSYWMSIGTEMLSPSTVWIDADVELGQGICLEPGVILKGQTKIYSDARIGAYSVIENSEIGQSSVVEAYSHIKEARVGPQNKIGPYARLRPGAILDSEVHVGNFVEIKKSHLAEGAKANHLSYVGDSTIGKRCNIGAGTITCNYDGFHKYETVLGDGVFVGSNSSLVAPVTIGAGAIIGAGSVITKDVDPNAIALERSDQRELKGAAEKFRQRKKREH